MSIEDRAMEELARLKGISVTQLRMELAAPTDVIRAIVADNVGSIHDRRSSLLPPRREPEAPRSTGWQDPKPLGPPEGIDLVDRLVDAQDERDRRELERKLRDRE
jgi:hypothetical protein